MRNLLTREWRPRTTWWRKIENPLEEDTGSIIGQDSVANLFVIKYRSLDLKLGADEGELHEGQLVSPLQIPGLHLHVRLVDPEGFARLNVGDKKSELCIKIEEEDSQSLCDHDPVLGEGPENMSVHQKISIIIIVAITKVGSFLILTYYDSSELTW